MTETLTDPSIYYSPYRLESAAGLNSASTRRLFDGVLIKIGSGYGCIHPWPELGDPSLEKCLKDLNGARRWPVVKRAIRCAQMDGAARELEDWMFDEVEVPESHATVVEMTSEAIEAAVEAGFHVVKLKCGRDLKGKAVFLREMNEVFPQMRWRLDFNETLEPDEAISFLRDLSEVVRGQVDFIEDPSPYSASSWKRIRREVGVNLALDRESSLQHDGAQVMVIKPAVDEPYLLTESALGHGKPVVVTSYMQHPLGQAFDAWNAMSMGVTFPGAVGVCGLQTHGLFEPNEFTEALGPVQPAFSPAEGLGLGFDELLAKQEWKCLA